MKAIASVAVAGMLAATSLTTTTVTADAGGKHWKHHNNRYNHHNNHYNHRYNGYYPGAGFATGAILGLTLGAGSAPTYYYPPPVYYYPPPAPLPPAPRYGGYYSESDVPYAQHVSWCSARYRSYNADYNTWVGYDGYVHECVSPFQ
jgi:hypothetical protein